MDSKELLRDPLDLDHLHNFTYFSNGFEAAALQSCILRHNQSSTAFDFVKVPAVNAFNYLGLMTSTLAGVLIFSMKRNRYVYPQNFIGMMCLIESSWYVYEAFKFSNQCTDYPNLRALLRNSLVLKDSSVSNMLGWHSIDLNEV